MSNQTTKAVLPIAGALPFVSIIMPVYNEEKYIQHILESVLEQDYPRERFEVIVADGMSSDHTAHIVQSIQAAHPEIKLIQNHGRIVSTGLNCAIAKSQAEVVVRLDGHCEYPKDYVRRVVELRTQLGADNVGGVLEPVGSSYVQRAVAAAYRSRVGIGGSALRAAENSDEIKEVDAVHGGCWQRARLLEAGCFDESMVRNQDDELSFRLRKGSGRIYQATGLRVKYHVRNSFRKLFLQFAQYGYWKVRVIRKHPRQAGLRHFIPALFVSQLVLLIALAAVVRSAAWALGGLLFFYLSVLWVVSLLQFRQTRILVPGVVIALATMHMGYGLGFLAGCLRLCLGALPTDRFFERVTR